MKKIVLGAALVAMTGMMMGTATAGDAAAGKAKAAVCNACHGVTGISAIPAYPNLAGQKEAYLVKQLNDFKSGARKDPTMTAMAAPLSDADVANLAAHFAGMK